jgi:two-component system LytT family response regulator
MNTDYLIQMPLIEIKTRLGVTFIKPFTIVFIEANNKHASIYVEGKGLIETCNSLKWFNDRLKEPVFFKCHNSYIVNCYYFECLCGNELILFKKLKVPISRSKKPSLRKNLELYYNKILSYSNVPIALEICN